VRRNLPLHTGTPPSVNGKRAPGLFALGGLGFGFGRRRLALLGDEDAPALLVQDPDLERDRDLGVGLVDDLVGAELLDRAGELEALRVNGDAVLLL